MYAMLLGPFLAKPASATLVAYNYSVLFANNPFSHIRRTTDYTKPLQNLILIQESLVIFR